MIDVGAVLEGRYAITRRLARGGMAEVFIARDRALERDVAVKVVRPSSADDRARFEREARLLAGLEHPNLVRVYGAHHTDDEAYIVLEYVEGPTLAAVVAGGPLGPAHAAEVGAQLADALAFIHARGVIHRDVKPSNVFVGDDGRVRLSDFGIARHHEDTHVTQVGMIVGTGAYMAPEQVEGRGVTAAADVYALGLVLLEALTGRHAYVGTAAETTIARLARQPDIPALAAPWPALLAAMTAREPEQRPTATQVATQLRGAPATAGPATTVLPVPAPVAPVAPVAPRRRGRGPLVAALVLVALALVALVALARGGDRGPAAPTTTTTRAPTTATTVTTAPTTTVVTCAQLQSQRDALDDQEKLLDEQLKGKALQDAKRQLADQKDQLDKALEPCG